MFEHFTAAKRKQLPRWLVALFLLSIGIHAVAIGAMVLHGWWQVDRLALPAGGVTLAVAAPPPPPPAARKGAEKPQQPRTAEVRRQVHDTTQPVRVELSEPVSVGDQGDQLGRPDGSDWGTAGPEGCVGPDCCAGLACTPIGVVPEVASEPPPCFGPSCGCTGDDCDQPPVVSQHAIEARRISGDPKIYPPDPTITAIRRDGVGRVVTTVKMCLSSRGTVQRLDVLKSSGYPAYDALIRSTMRTWRYEPFEVNGAPVPICTAVTFIYNQR